MHTSAKFKNQLWWIVFGLALIFVGWVGYTYVFPARAPQAFVKRTSLEPGYENSYTPKAIDAILSYHDLLDSNGLYFVGNDTPENIAMLIQIASENHISYSSGNAFYKYPDGSYHLIDGQDFLYVDPAKLEDFYKAVCEKYPDRWNCQKGN